MDLFTEELTIDLVDGAEIRLKVWGKKGFPIVAVHGWMDNAASFDPIAPYLVQAGYQLFCVDLTGHGKSSHRDSGTPILIWVVELIEVIKHLGFEEIYLMGHSMGAGISTIVSSVLKTVKKTILIDLDAPFSVPDEFSGKLLKIALSEREKVLSRKSRIYPDIDSAVKKMMSTNPYIEEKSVRLLVSRGTENVIVEGQQGIRFLHDPKLVGKPLQTLSEGQIISFIKGIECPVLLVWGTKRNFTIVENPQREKSFKNLKVVRMEGGHHLHMDLAEDVSKVILEFIGKKNTSKL